MQTYWISNDESDEKFWEHEWSTHGTCVNTIDPSCYTNYYPQEEVGDYFQKVVDLFKSLDTYQVRSLLYDSSKQKYIFAGPLKTAASIKTRLCRPSQTPASSPTTTLLTTSAMS